MLLLLARHNEHTARSLSLFTNQKENHCKTKQNQKKKKKFYGRKRKKNQLLSPHTKKQEEKKKKKLIPNKQTKKKLQKKIFFFSIFKICCFFFFLLVFSLYFSFQQGLFKERVSSFSIHFLLFPLNVLMQFSPSLLSCF